MALLKTVHVSDVPSLDSVPDSPIYSSSLFTEGVDVGGTKAPKFLVIGHRGSGMNNLQSPDRRTKAFRENSILSFNNAASHPLDFIEFDVQVTRDDCPVIFHDNFIFSEDHGTIYEKRVTELTLAEFLSYGPQREEGRIGKPLLRKTKEGKVLRWDVEEDDCLCTLQDAFHHVSPSLGFNIELKFDDHIVYPDDCLVRFLQSILNVVFEHAKKRPILFSTFHPDAALIVRKLQSTYPVYFLTNGGNEVYHDVRRNSLEEAIKLCLEGSLHGIVSEVKAIFRNPGSVKRIKEHNLSLLTYGKLNNVVEAAYLQHLMGIEGVIVDYVKEITEAVGCMVKIKKPSLAAGAGLEGDGEGEGSLLLKEGDEREAQGKPQFSQRELSFLLKLVQELTQ